MHFFVDAKAAELSLLGLSRMNITLKNASLFGQALFKFVSLQTVDLSLNPCLHCVGAVLILSSFLSMHLNVRFFSFCYCVIFPLAGAQVTFAHLHINPSKRCVSGFVMFALNLVDASRAGPTQVSGGNFKTIAGSVQKASFWGRLPCMFLSCHTSCFGSILLHVDVLVTRIFSDVVSVMSKTKVNLAITGWQGRGVSFVKIIGAVKPH
jgi:hypothetical protein